MADDYSSSGDTSSGGSTAVLEAPPASSSTTDSQASGDTTVAAVDEGDGSPESQPSIPNVPYDRFDDVNQKYQRLKWAEQLDQQQVQQRWQLTEWLDRDPQGFYNYLTTQLRNSGVLQPPQQTPNSPQSQQPDTMPAPDYQYRDEQGNVQQFYSAGRMQQFVQFLENKLTQRMAPLEDHISAQQTTWRAQQDAQRILDDAATWPHFQEFKGAIGQAMAQDRRLSIEGAYRKVVVPEIRTRERQALLAELKTKTGATTTSPSSAQPQSSEDLSKQSLAQLFKREMRRRGMGS